MNLFGGCGNNDSWIWILIIIILILCCGENGNCNSIGNGCCDNPCC